MMGLRFAGDVPFREVYIHGLIRDADGQKMSKSKGNVLDPLDLIDGINLDGLIEKRTSGLMQPHLAPRIIEATRRQFPDGIAEFGCDALRFTFASLATTGRDIRFDLGRIEGYRNFCNKIWNAARFVLMATDSLGDGPVAPGIADRWIRSRLDHTVASVHEHFGQYRLDLAAQSIYDFIWHEYCDWYIEFSKVVLNDPDAAAESKRAAQTTLLAVLEAALRLTHPLMPFITEEIWGEIAPRAGKDGPTIMLAPFPESNADARDPEAEADIDWLTGIVLGVRQIRGEMDISPGRSVPVLLDGAGESDRRRLATTEKLVRRIGRIDSIDFCGDGDEPPPSAAALAGSMKVLVPLAGLIDVDAEISRLSKRLARAQADLAKAVGKLANPSFVDNAPDDIVAQERRRQADFERQVRQIEDQIATLESG